MIDILLQETTVKKISEREREVLQMAANGFCTKEIADMLYVSTDTIETHSRNIVKKLNAKNMKHAIAIGIRKHIID